MLFRSLVFLLCCTVAVTAFSVGGVVSTVSRAPSPNTSTITLAMSDWSDFSAMEEDDDLLEMDNLDYAEENDSQEYKAQVGASLEPPSIEMNAEPIFLPQGKLLSVV